MSDVFISYSRVDRANVEALALALRDRGVSVWYDAAIAPGAPNFATVVRQELRAAPCVVVLWTAASVSSEWVYAEATEARTLRKIVLPVVVDNAEAPLPFNVAQSIQVSSGCPARPRRRSRSAVCAGTDVDGTGLPG